MQATLLIIVLAITVEALIQYIKNIIQMVEDKQYKTFATQLAAIAVATLLCFATGADVFALVGIAFNILWLGLLLTGIVISRGSNYAADFIKRLQNPDIGERVIEDSVNYLNATASSATPPNEQ